MARNRRLRFKRLWRGIRGNQITPEKRRRLRNEARPSRRKSSTLLRCGRSMKPQSICLRRRCNVISLKSLIGKNFIKTIPSTSRLSRNNGETTKQMPQQCSKSSSVFSEKSLKGKSSSVRKSSRKVRSTSSSRCLSGRIKLSGMRRAVKCANTARRSAILKTSLMPPSILARSWSLIKRGVGMLCRPIGPSHRRLSRRSR